MKATQTHTNFVKWLSAEDMHNDSKEWVLERMNAALQLILTNNYPIEDFFIYMAPPHKEADDININPRLLKVNVINSSDTKTFDTDVIKRFLDDLKTEVE